MQNTQLSKNFSDDTVFNMINGMFISLDKNEVAQNNIYLEQIIDTLINLMKLKDTLFAKAYKEIIFCGSYFKRTKISKPNEYDLNIVLKLPINYDTISFSSNYPAFTKIQIKDYLYTDTFSSRYQLSDKDKNTLRSFMTEDWINPNKFRQWIESILSKVVVNMYKIMVNGIPCSFKIKKSGPAFTLMLNILGEIENIDIDLVPVLVFTNCVIQGSTIEMDKIQNYQNRTWFAVAPLTNLDFYEKYLHWRLSFYYQEREILKRYGRIKPVIRQMKKLRDVQNWKSLASYYIENLFFNKLEKLEEILNTVSLTLLFFIMLKELQCAFKRHEIKYHWDANYNLLQKIGKSEMDCMAGRLNNIIKNIEQDALNPFIIAKYVLTADELHLLQEKFNNRQSKTPINNTWECILL